MSSHTKELVEKILSGLNAAPKEAPEETEEVSEEAPEEAPDEGAESECAPETAPDAPDGDITETAPDDEADSLLSNLEELRREYPELPLEELASNELFIRFARGKGNDFRTICADFDHFIDSVRQSILEDEKEKRKMQRRTGGGSRISASTYGLSRSQLDFLEEWNRENPDYAMTPKQYANSLRND